VGEVQLAEVAADEAGSCAGARVADLVVKEPFGFCFLGGGGIRGGCDGCCCGGVGGLLLVVEVGLRGKGGKGSTLLLPETAI